MPMTALDPVTALVVVDLQNGILDLPLAHPVAPLLARSRALADAFRAARRPVVLVTVDGVPPGRTERPSPFRDGLPPGFADLAPDLGANPTDILLTKRSAGAFATTDLGERLRALSVTQVVVVGVATGGGVEATARQAFETGFSVSLPTDAMTDRSAAAHDHAIHEVFPRIGETGSTSDVLALLRAGA